MTHNLPLLRAVREQIAKHPETHSQRGWAKRTTCGTTHCIAGWACALSGDTFRWEVDHDRDDALPAGEDFRYADYISSGVRVENRAKDLLGLDCSEVSDLFFDMSNASALERLDALIEKGESAA